MYSANELGFTNCQFPCHLYRYNIKKNIYIRWKNWIYTDKISKEKIVSIKCKNIYACFIRLIFPYISLYLNTDWNHIFSAAFLALRSIVVVELFGLHRLTSTFGLLILFQGVASVIGSPLAGKIHFIH